MNRQHLDSTTEQRPDGNASPPAQPPDIPRRKPRRAERARITRRADRQREIDRNRPLGAPPTDLSPESAKKMGAFFEFEVLDDQEQKTEPQRRRTKRQSDDTPPNRPMGKPRP